MDEFSIEFVANGESVWKGTAEWLPQGVRGFAFDTTKVSGTAVEFALTGRKRVLHPPFF